MLTIIKSKVGHSTLFMMGSLLKIKTLTFLNIGDGTILHMVLNRRDMFLIFAIMQTDHWILQVEGKAILFVLMLKRL